MKSDISQSIIKPKPSTFCVSFIILFVLFIYFIKDFEFTKGSWALPVSLLSVAYLDFMTSWVRLRSTKVYVNITRSTSIGHEHIEAELRTSETQKSITLHIEDLDNEQHFDQYKQTYICKPNDSVLAHIISSSPIKKTYIKYQVSTSTFGIISATRNEVKQVPGGLYHIEPLYDLVDDIKLGFVAQELGKMREYKYGDPIRNIRWPAYARSGKVIVLEQDPSKQRVRIVLDISSNKSGIKDHEYKKSVLHAKRSAASVIADILKQDCVVELWSAESPDGFYYQEFYQAASKVSRKIPTKKTNEFHDFTNSSVISSQEELTKRIASATTSNFDYPSKPFILIDCTESKYVK